MPNWKKVVVSGSAANLHSLNVSTDVTASNISSSGNIFGNLSENSSTSFKTVVVDPSTGQFYRTGSYGGGGGAGGSAFPFVGDGVISGSLLISSSNVGGVSTSSLTLQGSGSTIFEIQGSQGQLFSVTDDLIHDVFNVSDISGDTLLKVSGSGLVEIPVGNLSGSATSTASFGHYIGDGSELTGVSAFPFTGSAGISGSLQLDYNGNNNIIIGSGSGEVLDSGTHNIIFGNNAATSLTTGGSNLIIGHRAGKSTALNQESGNTLIGIGAGEDGTFLANYGDNTFIGYNAGKNSAAQFSTFVGSGVGQGTTSFSVAMGANGTLSCTAAASVALGYNSQVGGTNNYNVSIGTSAMRSSNGGSQNEYNVAIGYQAQFTSYRNFNNIVIGAKAAYGASYIKEDIFIGHEAGYSYNGTNLVSGRNTVIGYRAGYDLGDTSVHNILIGEGVGAENVVLNKQLKIGSGSLITISGSLETGDVIFHNTASAPNFSGSFQGDGSNLTGITATAGSTTDRVVFTTTNGELTTEAGFTYDATTNRLTVPNLTTTTFTSSFITSSQIHTSGSNIFGDDTTDTQTLIGTTKITGSAEVTGSLSLTGVTNALNFTNTNSTASVSTQLNFRHASGTDYNSRVYFGGNYFRLNNSAYDNAAALYVNGRIQGNNFYAPINSNGYNIASYNSRFTNNYLNLYGSSGVTFGASNAGFATIRDGAAGVPAASYDIDALLGIVSAGNSTGFGFKVHNSDDHETFAVQDNKNVIVSGSLEVSGSVRVKGQVTGSLTVENSGSTVFEVIGSEGTLFTVDDDLDGTLLDVKDKSGIPVLQASASGEIYLGQSPQSLYTTAVISSTTADVTQSLYGVDTSSYGGAFFDYTAHSGSNARGGTVSSVWTPGGSVVFSETTTTHIGDTSNLNLVVHFSQSQAQLACYADTSQYNIKVITRAI